MHDPTLNATKTAPGQLAQPAPPHLRQRHLLRPEHLRRTFRHQNIQSCRHSRWAQPLQMRALPAIHLILQQIFSWLFFPSLSQHFIISPHPKQAKKHTKT
ncbi:MAG: hypothetical protein J6L70_04240 [Alphaproteobacteria bacterium]|nr:hypothetical protein [Alphaproteobacteria bacterium]